MFSFCYYVLSAEEDDGQRNAYALMWIIRGVSGGIRPATSTDKSLFSDKMRKTITFGAGPAQLPYEVLHRIQREMIENEHVSGISALEVSHRSADFNVLLKSTEKLLRDQIVIPDEYTILFMHGGGTGQFAALPQNLQFLSTNSTLPTADYLVTGTWSDKASKEADKFLKVNRVLEPRKKYTSIPPTDTWNLSKDAAYLYYCANETIHGVEFYETPNVKANLVADISSNILSRPFDVSRHCAVIAGTQKNLGAAGLALVFIKKDLLGRAHPLTPSILDYNEVHKANSIYNTPPVFNIYVTKLVLEWIRDQGGPEVIFERNRIKATMIYNLIDSSSGFYSSDVDPSCRSQMNIPFRIGRDGGSDALEAEFLKQAEGRQMLSLKGHRSIGGIRASLYNSVTVAHTEKLAKFMQEFQQTHDTEFKSKITNGYH